MKESSMFTAPDVEDYLELLGYSMESCQEAEAPAGELRQGASKLVELELMAKRCVACPLSKSRRNVVFGAGSPTAKIMFVGEAPGFHEDQEGRPFVGPAGELLTKMIQAMGFGREEVYIANVLKCRPPENRDPSPEEIAFCQPYLTRQIELIQPKVIVALGTFAAQVILETDQPISRMRGREWSKNLASQQIKVFPTFHPAYLLRNADRKKDVWEDLKRVMASLGS